MPPTPVPTADPRPDWLTPEVWPFEVRTLEVHGHRVAYTDEGDGPVLLFCHAGLWSFVWRDVIDRLRHDFRCITFDPPGSGLSGLSGPGGADDTSLARVRDTVRALVDHLGLDEMTLVLHDLGGVTGLAAADALSARVVGVAAVNTFGWRPTGPAFRGMLAVFGSAVVRWSHAGTGWLTALSSTRFGVGRHLDRAARRAFRRGMHRPGRRAMHRLMRSARRSAAVYAAADRALDRLVDLPALAVFGALGDYLRFRRRWRARLPRLREVTVPWGLHFPMCDDPDRVAAALASWHREEVAPGASHPTSAVG